MSVKKHVAFVEDSEVEMYFIGASAVL